MAVDVSLPLLFVQQQGPAGRLAHDVVVYPEVAQAMSRQMAEALLRQASQQVQKMEDPSLSTAIKEEDKGQAQAGQGEAQQRQQEEKTSGEPVETWPSSEGPFLGKLVNHKV